MAFGQPQQQTNAMGQVAQQGRTAMGMGAVQRPMLSGAVKRSGPNQARMDPMAGQLQAANLARDMGQPVGMPPPPNPGLGPSAPPVNTALSSFAGNMGGGNPEPYGPPDTQAPNQQIPQLPAMKDPNAGGDPSMDQAKQNFLNQLKMMYGGQGMMGSVGQGGSPNAGAWGNAIQGAATAFGNQGMKTPGNPMMARGGMGIGPSFMGGAQPIQNMNQPMQNMNQQPPNQPAPMTQSRRFGGGTPWNVG